MHFIELAPGWMSKTSCWMRISFYCFFYCQAWFVKNRNLKMISHVLCSPEWCVPSNLPHASDVCLDVREHVRCLLLRAKHDRAHNSEKQSLVLFCLPHWRIRDLTGYTLKFELIFNRIVWNQLIFRPQIKFIKYKINQITWDIFL